MRALLTLLMVALLTAYTVGCGGGDASDTQSIANVGVPAGAPTAAAPVSLDESSSGGSYGGDEYGEEEEEYDDGDGGYGDDYGDEEEYEDDEGYGDDYGEEMEEDGEEGYGDDYGDEEEYGDDEGYGDDYGDEGGSAAAARPEPTNLKEKAVYAFEDGLDDEGFRYLYAYYLTDPQGAQEQEMHWIKGLVSPRTAVRWGIFVDYDAPDSLDGSPPIIGQKPSMNSSGGGSGASDRPGDSAEAQLRFYTGEVGERFVDRLNMRRAHTEPYYGNFLATLPGEWTLTFERKFGGALASSGRSGGGGGGYGDDYGDDYGGDEYGDDYGDEYGDDYGDDYGDEYGGGSSASRGNRDGGKQLVPGVMWLGTGPLNIKMAEARKSDIDLLLMFDVNITQARNGLKSNNTKMTLYRVKDGQPVVRQRRALADRAVWATRERLRDSSKDPVDLAIDEILNRVADIEYRAEMMPEIPEESLKKHITEITASPLENPLPVLAEIKYFNTRGQWAEPLALIAYGRLIGEEKAKILVMGTQEEKEAALAEWIESPENNLEGVGPDGEDGGDGPSKPVRTFR